ncbi:hypothetical protein TRFO_31290 [Tritrichomonas foetus]|uniref:Uncharacterized protein n=1 Tax=Tritrichomonas foetus TaxID=1144522 RepID=A0A1J4JWX0_9EUKA|nr:hypothetical protein TRFO_31290 [Tritrichomonas foetus]|eukprot:OHT01773.1 hypothetical protein TRFO_31290 [Tritrichomonas foetus]
MNDNATTQIHSLFAITLRELTELEQKSGTISKILSCLEADLDKQCYSISELPIIAHYLHQIYTTPSSYVRTSVINICFQLELFSDEIICELYNFDYLVVNSLDQRVAGSSCRSDEEKQACFKYILFLIHSKEFLPLSIVRSLIALYLSQQRQYKTFVLSILCEFSILNEDIFVPEIGEIFVDSLINNGSQDIVNVVTYGFEHHLPYATNRLLMSQLISPLSQFDDTFFSYDKVCNSLTSILMTWPGLFAFGIEMDALSYIMSCFQNKTRYIIPIFKKLLIFKDIPNIVTNSYCGFLMKMLMSYDFLPIINNLAKTSSIAANLYNSFLPHISKYFEHKLPRSGKNATQSKIQVNPSEIIVKMSDVPILSDILSYQLPADINLYDWNIIQMRLSMLLPSNDNEFKISRNFLQGLIFYYSGPFLHHNHTSKAIINECLIDLFDFLIESTRGVYFIQTFDCLRNAFIFSIHSLYQKNAIDSKNPIWPFFTALAHLMSTQNGVNLLTKFELLDSLRRLGELCSNLKVIEQILSIIRFQPDGGWAIPVYGQFLNADNPKVSSLAIKELRKKLKSTSYPKVKLFSMLLIPHIKTIHRLNEFGRIYEPLGLLNEMIHSDQSCFDLLVNDKHVLSIIAQFDHFIYSFILSDPKSHPHTDLENEINWWMNEGNMKYLDVYDKSVEYSFTQNQDILLRYPSIITTQELATIPSHLFSQLPRNETGLELLRNKVPELVKLCESNSIKEKRAAFFALSHLASVPGTCEIIIENKITETLISEALNSKSYVMKGTLINCLSMFKINDPISMILRTNGFELFVLGHQKTIIPTNINNFLEILSRFEKYEHSCSESIKYYYSNYNFINDDYKMPINSIPSSIPNQILKPQTDNADASLESNNNSLRENCLNRSIRSVSRNENTNDIKSEVKNDTKNKKADRDVYKELSKGLIELLNPITSKDAKGHLFALSREIPNEVATADNAMYAHRLMESFSYSEEERSFIISLFKQAPLFVNPDIIENKFSFSQKNSAISQAIIFHILQKPDAENSIENYQLPVYSLKDTDIKARNICMNVPEVYISDEEFTETVGMSKEEFYNLEEDEKQKIREKLIGN